MSKFTLLAQEEDERAWGLGHFTKKSSSVEAGGKKEGRRACLGQELQDRGADARGELFRGAHKVP